MRNRQILYLRRPIGKLTEDCFALKEVVLPSPKDGEMLLRLHFLSIDPYQRRQMLGIQGYPTQLNINGVMTGRGVAEIVASRHPNWRAGQYVLGDFGWQEWAISNGTGLRHVPPIEPLSLHLGLLGASGETAWYGLTQIGRPVPDNTVIVSAAAGAVGSAAGQIAKLLGCRVIGIAGGAHKCSEVTRRFGFDACLDYREPNLSERLQATLPLGADVAFENVGGAILDAVLPVLKSDARIALCGLVAHYNRSEPFAFINFMKLLDQTITLKGFRIGQVAPELRAEARQALMRWWEEGKLQAAETVTDGIESAPGALISILEGGNIGKRIIRMPWG